MQLQTTTTHKVTFSVQAFWNEEGGMGTASYGPSVANIGEAITNLQLAKISDPKVDWVIVCDVATSVVAK